MVDQIVITGLLKSMADKHSHLSWKMRCKFNDGVHEPIHEIVIVNRLRRGERKEIVFQMGSGKILKCGKSPVNTEDNVIDMLLDLFNAENAVSVGV